MTLMVLTAAVALVVTALMEAWAAFMHGRLWHGVLWPAHRSHHPEHMSVRRGRSGGWEFNDVFGLLHALMAALLVAYGLQRADVPHSLALGTAIGMTAFGCAYAVVHDGFVHGRLPVGVLRRSAFLRRVAAAHRVHHKLGGPPYGLFSGPWVLRRLAATRKKTAATRLAQTQHGA